MAGVPTPTSVAASRIWNTGAGSTCSAALASSERCSVWLHDLSSPRFSGSNLATRLATDPSRRSNLELSVEESAGDWRRNTSRLSNLGQAVYASHLSGFSVDEWITVLPTNKSVPRSRSVSTSRHGRWKDNSVSFVCDTTCTLWTLDSSAMAAFWSLYTQAHILS